MTTTQDEREYVYAVAEALRSEYKAITDAGYILQIDAPVGKFETQDMTLEAFRARFERSVEALNHALEGIPEEQVRFHLCFGSWHGPHGFDLEMKNVVDLVLKVNAQAYTVEMANPRHEHEWKVWRDTKLPDGKILMPGVVTHSTNTIEHPELVADRIERIATVVGRQNVGREHGLRARSAGAPADRVGQAANAVGRARGWPASGCGGRWASDVRETLRQAQGERRGLWRASVRETLRQAQGERGGLRASQPCPIEFERASRRLPSGFLPSQERRGGGVGVAGAMQANGGTLRAVCGLSGFLPSQERRWVT